MTLKEWWHKLGSPRWFFRISTRWGLVFGCLALVLLVTGTIWGLAFAPADYQQGNSFRIIYVHVPTAIVAQSAYMLMGAAGLVLLVPGRLAVPWCPHPEEAAAIGRFLAPRYRRLASIVTCVAIWRNQMNGGTEGRSR